MRTRAARFVAMLVIFVIGLSPVGLVGTVAAQELPRPGGEVVFEKRLLDEELHYIFTFQWHRIVPHNARLKGWTIAPSHFLNNQLDTVWLAPE
jgi:hypothetical protein